MGELGGTGMMVSYGLDHSPFSILFLRLAPARYSIPETLQILKVLKVLITQWGLLPLAQRMQLIWW